MTHKLVESRHTQDQWTIYRRVWFWWYPIATRTGLSRAVEFVELDRFYASVGGV
jgi:hypothetical protein